MGNVCCRIIYLRLISALETDIKGKVCMYTGINIRVSFLAFMQVHVVPAHMFRKVISITKSHCKLGLTGMYFRKSFCKLQC